MVERLGDSASFYKVGYQLAFASGLAFVDELIRGGKQVFLDMKLHDIENTVGKGVESVAKTGVTFLTVHAYPQTMKAAVAARAGSKLKILAVTVLTSYDDIDLAEAGYDGSVETLVARRAQQAQDIGDRRAGVLAGRSLAAAARGRQPDAVRDAGRAARRARARRPEARRDARLRRSRRARIIWWSAGRSPAGARSDPKAARAAHRRS